MVRLLQLLTPLFFSIASGSIVPKRENSSVFASHSPAHSSTSQPSTCQTIRVRKEWRTLSYQEKLDYINAVKRLAQIPSKLLGHSYRRWDDFEYVHCESRKHIHTRPLFLPWHRYFTFIYEQVLRDECQFRGIFPYWNWTLDSDNITHSPIWSSDPNIGFGSNGTFFGKGYDPDDLGSGVVNDGAFAKFPIYYPGKMMLQRNFRLDPPLAIPGYYLGSQWYDSNNLDFIFSQTNFSSFLTHLEGDYLVEDGARLPGPHLIIHSLLGGDMPRLAYSANDPIFFPHHARVDQCWFTWVKQNWTQRVYQYLPAGGFSANLDDKLDYMGLVPSIKVRDVMNPLVPPLCYEYK